MSETLPLNQYDTCGFCGVKRSDWQGLNLAGFRACVEALRFLMKALESGALVRDLTHEEDPDWHMTMMTLVLDLTKAQHALTLATTPEAQP